MSIIGPRPQLVRDMVFMTDEQRKRHTARVMKQKGIDDAINAVVAINEKEKKTCYSLDIYGPIDPTEKQWLEELMAKQPSYIKYMNYFLNNEFIISGIIDKFFVQFELSW